jgi:predicted AlkP superfamily phosphohydrolase/phosphomutase
MRTHSFSSEINGPNNPLVDGNPITSVPVTIYRDPIASVVKIELPNQVVILKEGEWSDWVPLKFEFIPMIASASGMVRFYAKKIHPEFLMYVTPVNIDPMDPALPICSPEGYSKELAEKVGRFYTQGLPADTKALNEGVMTSEDFFSQAKVVLKECIDLFDYQFSKFKEGCFVFYFSSIDQNSHMLWRCMDPNHPLYEENASPEVKAAIRYYYETMDKVLGQVLDKVDSNTDVIALSDHGFTDFTREFHLSTWLYENGYISITHPNKIDEMNYFDYVDWSKTKAYPVGINGLYLNLKDREKNGSVTEKEVNQLKQELAKKLTEIKDPKTGIQIIRKVYDAKTAYSGPFVDLAPDLLIGYERSYRISDEAILGKFPRGIIGDRTKAWSADHCMDPVALPGVLFTNRKINTNSPAIWDLAPTILSVFGIEGSALSGMDGKKLF